MFGWLKRSRTNEKPDQDVHASITRHSGNTTSRNVKLAQEAVAEARKAFEDRNCGLIDSEPELVPSVADRVQAVLDQWKEDQGIYMLEEVRKLICEIEDALGDEHGEVPPPKPCTVKLGPETKSNLLEFGTKPSGRIVDPPAETSVAMLVEEMASVGGSISIGPTNPFNDVEVRVRLGDSGCTRQVSAIDREYSIVESPVIRTLAKIWKSIKEAQGEQ